MNYRLEERDDCVVVTPERAGNPDAAVIWLHGLGADGRDFLPIVPELHLPPTSAPRFVFPHAPVRAVTINSGMRMRAWYDILGLAAGAVEDERGIRESGALVEQYIRREREAGIATHRILLAGFSQGGAIALHAGLRHEAALAGVLALSTYLPLQQKLTEAATVSRSLAILMCHGREDPIVPIDLAERSRDLLRASGYTVGWKEYRMQHQVCAEEIADIAAWLRTQLARSQEPS
jgi:phospholipase/carboxylesterase